MGKGRPLFGKGRYVASGSSDKMVPSGLGLG